MSIKLVKTTSVDQVFNVVSVTDDAIDWEKTYPEIEAVEDKRIQYKETRDLMALAFKPNAAPTVFVFKHPNRADVNKNFMIITRQSSGTMPSSEEVEMIEEVMNKNFISMKDGFDGQETVIPRRGNKITRDFMQSLLDTRDDEEGRLFDELAGVYMTAVFDAIKPTKGKSSQKK